MPKNKLPDKKEMMKESSLRGIYAGITTLYQGIDLSTIAWEDNKIVTTLSSYVGAEPVTSVKKFDKNKNEKLIYHVRKHL